MAESATMTPGTNGSTCTVNGKAGVKVGTSKLGGDMTVTVGAGATKLTLYAAAWKGVSGLSLNISGATTSPTSIALTADDGISNNSPFTLSGSEDNFKFEIELSNITTETAIKFTSSTTKRFVIWGASYETGSAPAVATPAISGEDNFEDETTVTITCATTGASIYYTLDETDPTSASTLYEEPFTLTETKTVKAIAIEGEDASSVASKTFTKLDRLTCAQFAALTNNAVGLLDEVVVTYAASDGKNIWLKDASGALLLYYASGSYGLKAGDVVNGLKGSKTTYQTKVVELVPSKTLAELKVTEGEAPAPEELTAAPTDADINKYVVFKDVAVSGSFTEGSISNVTMTVAGTSVTLRNNFKNGFTFTAGKNYNVVGLVSYYSSNYQVYFISAEESGCSNEVTITKGAEENGTYELSAEKVCGDDEGGFVEVTAITPAAGYEFDEITTSASGTVDNENKKVTGITANTTITVKFKAIPKYTVTFDLGISKNQPTLTESEGGAGITLPAGPVPVCAEWAFAGWAEAKVASETTAALELFKAGDNYKPAKDVTLYAVYKRVEGGSGVNGTVTVTYNSTNFPTSYGTANTFTEYELEGYKFKIQQIYKNGEKMQWRASGHSSGTGTIYNTQVFPAKISSIVLTYDESDGNKNHTLKVGDEENPAEGTAIEGVTVGLVETFDCSAENVDYFVIENGTGAGYTASIAINYGEIATTYYFSTPSCWATSVDNTDATKKAVKFIQNGQLFIEMNGRIYNVQGQTVK